MNTTTAPTHTPGTVDRLAETAHQTVDRVAAKAGPTVEQVRGAATRAGEMVGAGLDNLVDLQDEWVGSARHQVRTHPLAYVGAAVLAGLVIGRFMR